MSDQQRVLKILIGQHNIFYWPTCAKPTHIHPFLIFKGRYIVLIISDFYQTSIIISHCKNRLKIKHSISKPNTCTIFLWQKFKLCSMTRKQNKTKVQYLLYFLFFWHLVQMFKQCNKWIVAPNLLKYHYKWSWKKALWKES